MTHGKKIFQDMEIILDKKFKYHTIYMARTIGSTDRDVSPPLDDTEQKGYLLICDLCQNGTNSVQDMRLVNTDAKYH